VRVHTCSPERKMLAGHATGGHRRNLQLQISRKMYRQYPTLNRSWKAVDEVDRTL
jgi:hypothetical protein